MDKKPELEIIKFDLGVNMTELIKERVEKITEVNLPKLSKKAKPKKVRAKEESQAVWDERCQKVADLMLKDAAGVLREKILEVTGIKNSQLSIFSQKFNAYMKEKHDKEVTKIVAHGRTRYMIAPEL